MNREELTLHQALALCGLAKGRSIGTCRFQILATDGSEVLSSASLEEIWAHVNPILDSLEECKAA